jgi:lysozyme
MTDQLALTVAEHLCKRWEGLRLRPYLCPAGVATIGYGTTRYPDGRSVQLTDAAITPVHAIFLLRWHLENTYIPGTLSLCPSLEGERLGAITDFAYNLGLGRLKTSTLRKRINAGRWDDVPTELRKWVNAGGRRLDGLVARREHEIQYI